MGLDTHAQQLFVEALRSGRYRQGTNAEWQQGLDGQVLHCAYGVLADCYQRETGQQVFFPLGTDAMAVNDEPRQWLGLTTDQLGELVNRNDAGESFESLARWVEGL